MKSWNARSRACGAWALGLSLLGGVMGAAQAQIVLPPDQDPFYIPPANYQSQPNGAILASRTINAVDVLPFISSDVLSQFGTAASTFAPYFTQLQNLKIDAYQVLYKSLDAHNQPTTGVSTILVPQGPWIGSGSRPVIVDAMAEDSVRTSCAPSYNIRAGLLSQQGGWATTNNVEIAFTLPALLNGYALVYPDHEGPQSQFLIGPQAGHSVLDGIRAALHYAPANLATNAPVGLFGYSGGGGAAAWAAALKKTYAPELNIVGAALGAPANANLNKVYAKVNGAPLTTGFFPMAFVAFDRAYPEAGLMAYMNPAGQQLLQNVASWPTCLGENLVLTGFIGPMENYTIAPNVWFPDSAPGKFLLATNSLVGQPASLTPSMPILSFGDLFDELVPVTANNELAAQYCRAGAQVEVMRTSTPVPFVATVHTAGAFEGVLPAYNYLTNRFLGKPPRNDCSPLGPVGVERSVPDPAVLRGHHAVAPQRGARDGRTTAPSLPARGDQTKWQAASSRGH